MSKPRELALPGLVFFVVWLLTLLSPIQALARSIRSVTAGESSITLIHTALGYSTILEFDSKPISAVLGDQDSFRLEYVGKSITIKPLLPFAKSNLFIFTEYDRFNCQLVSGPQVQVDYLVRLRADTKSYPVKGAVGTTSSAHMSEKPPKLITRIIRRSQSYAGFRLTIQSVARERDLSKPRSVTLIDFELSSAKSPYTFQARSLGVKQEGKFLDLESLYLDRLELAPGAPPVHGKLALLSQDFKPSSPVTLVFAVPAPNGINAANAVHRIEVSTAAAPFIRKPKVSSAVNAAVEQLGKTNGKGH